MPAPAMNHGLKWQFWIDRGGTFTDIVARRPDGSLATAKLLSENPEQYADAAVEGMRRLLGLAPEALITPDRVACVKMGTTVATNALLERRGDRTVLVITRGFGDALRIAYQNRPRLFDRRITLPELLYEQVIEADERVGSQGEVLQALDEAALARDLQAVFDTGIRACAIVFMHGWRSPAHEQVAARIADEIGFTQVSVSHAVSPLMKLVPRGDTTVVDAYLSPILRRYVAQVAAQMPGVPLYFMQSSGGLTEAGRFQGKDAILSGPAGGIVGMVRTALAAGHGRLIGFDMGGTSTDVSHFSVGPQGQPGEFERAFDTQVAGVRLRAPMMDIHTVAAGGGSIIGFDGARLRVGPASAGAHPGPAAYRRGGPLTVTDANVMLGRLQPAHFPAVFGPAADQPLDAEAVRRGFAELAARINQAGLGDAGQPGAAQAATPGNPPELGPTTPEAVAAGALQIAVASMANAIKRISVARGHDVTAYTLQCFGGAGGQHACAVADALGMQTVLIHPLAGVLSAYGMGLADQTALREASIELTLDQPGLALARQRLAVLGDEAAAEVQAQGVQPAMIRRTERLRLRYAGTDTALPVALAGLPEMQQAFEAAYRQRFAFGMPGRALVIEAVTVEALGRSQDLPGAGDDAGPAAWVAAQVEVPPAGSTPVLAQPLATVRMHCAQDDAPGLAWRSAGLYQREALAWGATLTGPAVIAERNATTVVEPGWQASVGGDGSLTLRRTRPRAASHALGTRADPVMLEVFNNLFMNIAEQMGQRLQNTAHSVNIKERLDFSCALFDAQGELIANAPHMPVHLGSMSESIKTVIARNPAMQPGDVYVLNDPYHGGTHLPDVTVVTPVCPVHLASGLASASPLPQFYVASRGHHADIGGITPGSVPPFSRHIGEEGVLIDNLLLVRGGHLHEAELRQLLASGPWPARNPDQTLADLRAQIAANEKGVQELHAMTAQWGDATVAAYMGHVQDNAEASVRRVIGALQDGEFRLPMDNGAHIQVKVTVDAAQRSAVIDFSGTSPQQPDNFNAPRAVTTAAVLYVFRTLVDDDIPLNAGCLKPLRVIVPEGCLLNPRPPAAVVAGNVETSSCVTNALYGALGVMAGAPCTMNNFTFGNASHQYYETIAGGSGAGPGFAGTAVVQTHMTNSRLTDPEVLEHRFPVRLDSYAIRRGSGGAGQWRGGDGGVRRLRFLQAMTAAILSNGRLTGAFGASGGQPGAVGRNRVERSDGTVESLGYIATVEMAPGDVFVIETPGGGGWGRAGQ